MLQTTPQKAELLFITPSSLPLIEEAGRTCYKSKPVMRPVCDCVKTNGVMCQECRLSSASSFVKRIIKSGHESVLEHASATFRLTTERGVSHELVRHRVGVAFSQESTRYCNYDNRGFMFVEPPGLNDEQRALWTTFCDTCEKTYHIMVLGGLSPQIARSVLPTCIKTELVMSANFREWRTILKLRLDSSAHPQIRELMSLVLSSLLNTEAKGVFDDIEQ